MQEAQDKIFDFDPCPDGGVQEIHFAVMDEIDIVYGNRIFERRLLCELNGLEGYASTRSASAPIIRFESSSHIVCALRISKKRMMLAGLPENFNHALARFAGAAPGLRR
jgi:hypothetical protein